MKTETIRVAMTDGIDLVADVAGPLAAPTVILGHGGGQTRHSWDKCEIELARAGYRAINYDLRGHGESGWSPDGDYSIGRRVEDLFVLADLAQGPVALVGASLGGMIAMIAATRGLPIAALVLVDIVPRVPEQGTRRILDFMTSAPDGFASLEEAADAIAAYHPDRPRPKSLAGLNKNLRLGDDGRYRWHWDPLMLGERGYDPGWLEREIEGAAWTQTVPTLLVRGMKSDIVTDEGVADLRSRVPALEVANIGGAGHMVAGDRNDAFNAAVLEFLLRAMPPHC